MQNDTHLQVPRPGPDCASYATLLPLLGLTMLEEQETIRLHTHLATCAYCQMQKATYDRIDVVLRQSFGAIATLLVSPEDMMVLTNQEQQPQPYDSATPAPPIVQKSRPIWRIVSLVSAVAAILLILLDITGILASRGLLFGAISRHSGNTARSTLAGQETPYIAGAYDVLQAIQMPSSTEGWAVGDSYHEDAQQVGTYSCLVLHFTHGQWMRVATPTDAKLGFHDADLQSIAVVSSNEGWAVGWGDNSGSRLPSGLILHYSAGKWTKFSIIPDAEFYSVQMLTPTDGWAVGGGGWGTEAGATTSILWHYDGSSWTPVPVPTVAGITSLDMVSANNGWATGTDTILHYDGRQWSIFQRLQGISGVIMDSATDGWAFGYVNYPDNHTSSYNEVWHYDGSQWVRGALPNSVNADTNILGLSMDSVNDGWAVGFGNGEKYGKRYSLYLHYTNGQWTTVQGPGNDNLNSVFMLSANEGWAIGNGGALVHYLNGTWTPYQP